MPVALAVDTPISRRLVPLALALLVALVAVELIRRRKLREEYAMLWIFTGAVLLTLASFPEIVLWLEDVLHVSYLTVVLLACFLFMAMIAMHFSTVISRQSEQIRQLAQRQAILEMELKAKADERSQQDGEPKRRTKVDLDEELVGAASGKSDQGAAEVAVGAEEER